LICASVSGKHKTDLWCGELLQTSKFHQCRKSGGTFSFVYYKEKRRKVKVCPVRTFKAYWGSTGITSLILNLEVNC